MATTAKPGISSRSVFARPTRRPVLRPRTGLSLGFTRCKARIEQECGQGIEVAIHDVGLWEEGSFRSKLCRAMVRSTLLRIGCERVTYPAFRTNPRLRDRATSRRRHRNRYGIHRENKAIPALLGEAYRWNRNEQQSSSSFCPPKFRTSGHPVCIRHTSVTHSPCH
jgi:hypothetical protein